MINKDKMKDSMGRYLTQGLFLEFDHKKEFAQFTLDNNDKVYKDKTYPSLKRLYLDFGDPVEYQFANHYLLDWQHWQKMCNNDSLFRHIEQWREELEILRRSEGVSSIYYMATEKESFQAAKWIADGGWLKRKAGRPSKEEVEGERKKQARIKEEFNGDLIALKEYKNK